MIFQRALIRELVSTAGAVFTTLFTITITVMLIKILGQAAGGRVASEDVVALIGFAALIYLPVILILTSFISVLMVVSRNYKDSEMVVWFASGLSLTQWIKPVLKFAFPIILITGLLSFLVTPWANQKSSESRERYEKRADLDKISPGKFQESASADRIFFVEAVSGDSMKVKNVFVNTIRDGKTSVVTAKAGTIEVDSRGDKFLVMHDGRRYDGVPTQPDFQMMEFERYGVLISKRTDVVLGDKSSKALPTLDLAADDNSYNQGELLWRLSLPIMCLLLTLLAIPLAFVNPRAGRSANLIIALLLAVIYLNMVSVFQVTVAQERLSLAIAWWPIHLLALVVIALLFSWRLQMNSRYHPLALLALFRRKRNL